jgi:ATP-dependent DNA helicase RecQ
VSKVFNIVFDEGHCVSQWGSTFRPEYKLVGMLRFIAPGIPFYITSATIPHPMLQDIKDTLHISNSLLFQQSNDRHNIAFCVKKMQHPASSFEDLAFLVPSHWEEHNRAPRKFMVFFDNKREAESASSFLRNRMPEALKHKVKWFHAGMT